MAAEYVIEDLTVLFSFRGRIKRGTFWDGWAACTLLGLFFGAVLLGLSILGLTPFDLWLVGGVLGCLPLWIWLAVGAKRWHDLGRSSIMLILNMLPLAALVFAKSHPQPAVAAGGVLAALVILYLGLAQGAPEANKFGDKAI
jgi:uncharacterized membrane protein YhaH (DUF805 family)